MALMAGPIPVSAPREFALCLNLKTGKIRWQDDSLGAATVLLAGDQL